MNKQLMALAMSSALVGILCSNNFATAQTPRPDRTNDPAAKNPTPSAIGGASAPGARLAALMTVNVNRTVTVFRSKGVAAVTSPSVGLVCIQPSSALPVNQIVPVLSIDFSQSVVGNNMVEYRSSGIGCPTGNIAVRTFVLDPNVNKRPDDGVAFTIVVP
jgi:hypothetical protein